jgi:ubiquinone/menaquinone biosynthesis C-methylase UbiE
LSETVLTTLKRIARCALGPRRGIAYWEARAKEFGARSVLNISHSEQEMAAVTAAQVREIFPHLKAQLKGKERLILDYGCGPGRFTAKLAEAIGGKAVGVDPIKTLIDLAPAAPNTSYQIGRNGRIPLADASVDVVWICLVLGGILAESVSAAVSEINRVLTPAGLLFIVENTEQKPSGPNWTFRSVAEYQAMFRFANLAHLHDYYDLGERISVLAGRRRADERP